MKRKETPGQIWRGADVDGSAQPRDAMCVPSAMRLAFSLRVLLLL